jgi:hypothetical protein
MFLDTVVEVEFKFFGELKIMSIAYILILLDLKWIQPFT